MKKEAPVYTVSEEDPRCADALRLLEELSAALQGITGSSGAARFDLADMDQPGAVFAIAWDMQGAAVACGCLRPMDEGTAELKRVYARAQGRGAGTAVLRFLEEKARAMGYERIVLETRRVNERAVRFYRLHGYAEIENYGRYVGRAEAICMEKCM